MPSDDTPASTSAVAGSTSKFTRPPLDGTLTVDQFCDWHRVHSSDAVTFVFPTKNGDQDSLTWKQLGDGILKGNEIIQKHIPHSQRERHGDLPQRDPMVVGFLATTDIIAYSTFLFSHIRLTHRSISHRPLLPFPISPRNSAAAISHLVRVAGVAFLWVTEGPMRLLVDEAMRQGGLEDTVILPFPSYSDLYLSSPNTSSSTSSEEDAGRTVHMDQPALIIHSSGSTAFPKPITLKHSFLFECSIYIDREGLMLEGEILSVHGSPIFHIMGMLTQLWPAVSGLIRAAPVPEVPQPPLTPELFLQRIVESKSKMVLAVPSFLETWAMDPDSIKALKQMKYILWGGGPLRKDVGQILHKEGVPIRTAYGATEFGAITPFSAGPRAEGYEWFEFMPHVDFELIPEEDEEDVYEVVFKESQWHHLAVHNTKVGNTPAYATNDLVERHTSNPKLFRLVGRKDDQIMLSTGEKTNPGPLETIICKNPHVKQAIMFGRERLSNGVLIEPTSHDEAERLGVEQFRNLIWPIVESANEYAPTHSRIFKEMILVASASKPLAYTGKNTPRRGFIIKDYAEEINAIYQAVEDSSKTNVPVPPGSSPEGGWTLEESMGFIHDVIHSIMKGAENMRDEDDIFGFGCDSLQATYIRNTLVHALRQVAPPAKTQMVPSNAVYQHPTIRDLAQFACQITRSANASVDVDTDEAKRQRLLDLVAKYTQDWSVYRPAKDAINLADETVLLTGSTGGLGSQLLAQLVAMPSVSRIYAFNRPAQKSSRDRHVEAFVGRGNNVALLDSEKIVYVEGDTAVDGFNIQPELFTEIRDSVTTIIHNAWRVNFNLATSSFEPAMQGVRRVIDLALKSPHLSPPRVIFTSSVGIVNAWSDVPSVSEAPFTDITRVNTSGYSESKWVSERILWTAGQETAVRPVIIRVGQLCGGINGNWNSREWFPSLVRACQVVGGAPRNRGLVSFVPVHVAASAIIELRHASTEFFHIVHPRPVLWETIIGHVSDALRVPLIPYDEWLTRLEASPKTDEALHRNPALHLIDFYRASVVPKHVGRIDDREAIGAPMYDTTLTVAEAPSLGPSRLAQLGRGDVESWIRHWRNTGALDA